MLLVESLQCRMADACGSNCHVSLWLNSCLLGILLNNLEVVIGH